MIDEQQIKKIFPEAVWYDDGFNVSLAKHSGQLGPVTPHVQRKPWGLEVCLVYGEKYAFKILYINAGKRFSLQKHEQKEESWFIKNGRPELVLNDKNITAKPGDIFHLPAGTVHRVTAKNGDVEIWEVSTPELWDIVRLSDDFGRK